MEVASECGGEHDYRYSSILQGTSPCALPPPSHYHANLLPEMLQTKVIE
jgi:hypothetical protein